MVLVNLVDALVDGDDFVDLLHRWDHFVLGLVVFVNDGLVDFDNVKVVLQG